ncbi:TetR/AcrR family transcriptional regulator [Paenibacillus sp. MER TA 81-3]|uniref:TetR/AcrR family transcriptional regulator n=1 Tax=Paenibacillus sp. MER TA 81-3 TaxID=2939573 RepID=UPI00203E5B43|nr:TetR/AcrR family transcriptional regulator [Paenibacillus sp. MER TA 81-3]MCM3342224.1 TetR/AcrR family transcriptional regulator [Paenibacillus sp. MER TA 81-3]
MPKIVTEHEKEMVREAMYTKGIELIRKKGVKRVTVEDITIAANIGKGSFYSYYNSKEELLYTIIKKNENRMFERVESVLSKKIKLKEKLIKALKEIYLAADSIVLYVSPSDIEYLLRKLPDEAADWEALKSNDYFSRTLSLCGIDESGCEIDVLACLMNALHFIGSQDMPFGERGREKALDILVHSIADYMAGGAKQ